jgi:hypothetical protein
MNTEVRLITASNLTTKKMHDTCESGKYENQTVCGARKAHGRHECSTKVQKSGTEVTFDD